MAYMSTEHAKEIRNNLKKSFPNFKFSVRKDHHTAISVSLLESPLDFSVDLEKAKPWEYIQLNEYYLEWYSHTDVLKQIRSIINEKNYDKSEPQFDHFDVGFYVNMNIGDYEKPYKQIK